MKVAVLGSGFAGRTLAGRMAELGHEVTVGTRDVAATMSRAEPDRMGNIGYAVWARDYPQVRLETIRERIEAYDDAGVQEFIISFPNTYDLEVIRQFAQEFIK